MAHDRAQVARRVDLPETGFFRVRLVRGGPWVAAELRQDGAGRWQAWVDGQPREPAHPDPAQADFVFHVWHYGERITESEHAFLLAQAAHARVHEPDSPAANPTRAIRIGDLPPPF